MRASLPKLFGSQNPFCHVEFLGLVRVTCGAVLGKPSGILPKLLHAPFSLHLIKNKPGPRHFSASDRQGATSQPVGRCSSMACWPLMTWPCPLLLVAPWAPLSFQASRPGTHCSPCQEGLQSAPLLLGELHVSRQPRHGFGEVSLLLSPVRPSWPLNNCSPCLQGSLFPSPLAFLSLALTASAQTVSQTLFTWFTICCLSPASNIRLHEGRGH